MDDEADIGIGPGRREDQARAHLRGGARFEHQEAPQAVVDFIEVSQFVGNGGARYVNDAAGDDASDLAFGMRFDHGDRLRPAHAAFLRPCCSACLLWQSAAANFKTKG
jgi:hypothetical protein